MFILRAMKRDDALIRNVARLCDLEIEYDMTLRVLAVVVEQLQIVLGAAEIRLADKAITDQPDLTAWRGAVASRWRATASTSAVRGTSTRRHAGRHD